MDINSLSLIGNTPLVRCEKTEKKYNLKARLYAKLESFNLTGSSKDRAALFIIREAEKNGLEKGNTIIEATSGNTGIGLAAIGSALGYRVVIIMPSDMSVERIKLIRGYGADVILTDSKLGMKGAVDKAAELHSELKGSIIADQFNNPANVLSHYMTTGPELWNETDGKIDCFVAGVGTGGTVTGCAKFLKEKKPETLIVAVEPFSSPLLNGGKPGSHGIQGIGANFIPSILDLSLIDRIVDVTDEDSVYWAKYLIREESLGIGISSGAAFCAALELAKTDEFRDKNIVFLAPDSSSRYLSTKLFEE